MTSTAFLFIIRRYEEHWVEFSSPELIGCISEARYHNKIQPYEVRPTAISSLRYLNNNFNVESNAIHWCLYHFGVSEKLPPRNRSFFPPAIDDWLIGNADKDIVKNTKYIADSSILANIMSTPFDWSSLRSWTILGKVRNGKLYLYPDTPSKNEIKYAESIDVLNKYMFVRNPNAHDIAKFSSNDEYFNEIYQLKVGKRCIIYSAEIPGIVSPTALRGLKQLKTAHHVDTALCGEFRHINWELFGYTWCKAALISAKDVYIARPQDDMVHNIEKLTIEEMIRLYDEIKEDSWNTAWNFLDDFLTFVDEEVFRVNIDRPIEEYTFRFQSFVNGKGCVACERLIDNEDFEDIK